MSNVRLWAAEWDRPFVIDGRHVDPAARSIEIADKTTETEPRVMAVLIELARRQGETVRRQELIDQVWRGAPGADPSLSNAISLLRRALKDTDADIRLIQTIPKQGYRLRAPVIRDASPDNEISVVHSEAANDVAAAVRWPYHPHFFRRVAFAVASLTVAVLFGSVLFTKKPVSVTLESAGQVSGFEPRSIAVLPFVNMSPDVANDYFSDGLAEEILNALAQIESLKVASRTDSFQFRGTDTSIEEISTRLKVANVLEGSVRKEDGQLRITAQLISASNGRHLWSSTYDRGTDDIFEIQQDIALNIANSLAAELSAAERELIAALPTDDLKAYEHYLIGNFQLRQWTVEGNRRAVDSFERAIELDPEFSEAHLAMGRAYYFAGTHYGWMSPSEAIPRVKASLVQGIAAKNPLTRAAALSVYGDVLAWNDRDWNGALGAYERAYELSEIPAYGYALTNSILGKHDDAIRLLSKLMGDGYEDNGTRNNLAWAYFNARRYEDARKLAQSVVSEDDTFADGYRVAGRAHLMLGNTNAAIESFSRADQLMDGAPVTQSDLAVALARAGRREEAHTILEELLSDPNYVPAPLIAQIYASFGDTDAAFEWLEKGIEDGARGVIFLKVNPLYDPLRQDPRFSRMLTQLNLES